MRSFWRGSALALIAAGFCLALGAPAQAGCVGLSGTADGFDKETAVSRAQLALADYVKQYKAGKRRRCRHRERHARVAAPLLAQQLLREHVLLQHFVRRLQARHSEQEFLHDLLVGRGIALCVYVRGQTLLVIESSCIGPVRAFSPICR